MDGTLTYNFLVQQTRKRERKNGYLVHHNPIHEEILETPKAPDEDRPTGPLD
jgi:hypothetical protein